MASSGTAALAAATKPVEIRTSSAHAKQRARVDSPSLLMVTTGLDFGGAEIQVVELAKRFAADGWQFSMVSLLPVIEFADDLEAAGVPLYALGIQHSGNSVRSLWCAFRTLRSLIKTQQPDVIHSHCVHANLLTRLANAAKLSIPLVCTAHSINEGARSRDWAYRLTDHRCVITTQVSPAGVGVQAAKAAGRVTPARCEYVPNGVDLGRFSVARSQVRGLRQELANDSQFVWIHVGRFEIAKDHSNLLQAFAIVAQRSDAVLALVGNGSLEQNSRELAATLGIEERVRWLGQRSDIPELLAASDAFVNSSAWEGLPISILEAAAISLPVVATDVGGTAEIVQQERCGYLVSKQNAKVLAEAMLKLQRLPENQRLLMGQQGRRNVEQKFELAAVVQQWQQLYRRFGVAL